MQISSSVRAKGKDVSLQTDRSLVTAPEKATCTSGTPDLILRSREKTHEAQIPFMQLRAAIFAFLNPTSEVSEDGRAETQGLDGIVGQGRDAAIRSTVMEVLEMSISYAFNEGKPRAMELTEHIRTVQSLFLKFFDGCTAANKGKSSLQDVYSIATDLDQAVICLENLVINSRQKCDD